MNCSIRAVLFGELAQKTPGFELQNDTVSPALSNVFCIERKVTLDDGNSN
jgi:hypothetical protein